MMHIFGKIAAVAAVGVAVSVAPHAFAQTAANLSAFQGLAPVSTLNNSPAGKAALTSDYAATGAIQNGTEKQPTLLPFAEQQQQALRDAFITGGNASELADALGTKLGGVYQAKAHYTAPTTFTSISPGVAELIAYTAHITGADANAGKFFFANGTTDGKKPVSAAALAVLTASGGTTDIFGKAYGHPAGSPGADPFGNSRPFQTEPSITKYAAPDFFGAPSTNTAYLVGPAQNLVQSPSFPSGHTTYGYTESLLLAIMVPERFQQEIARGAEYGNDRIILGAHYAMDVIAGRTLALHDVAQLLAGNPIYLKQAAHGGKPAADYHAILLAATKDLRTVLETGCGQAIAVCAGEDTSRFKDSSADKALYEATQTYGLPVVYPATANAVEDVAKLAPEAGNLLTVAFPYLSLAQADKILTDTEGPGGGFLDNGSVFGVYSRLNLYDAAGAAMLAKKE